MVDLDLHPGARRVVHPGSGVGVDGVVGIAMVAKGGLVRVAEEDDAGREGIIGPDAVRHLKEHVGRAGKMPHLVQDGVVLVHGVHAARPVAENAVVCDADVVNRRIACVVINVAHGEGCPWPLSAPDEGEGVEEGADELVVEHVVFLARGRSVKRAGRLDERVEGVHGGVDLVLARRF